MKKPIFSGKKWLIMLVLAMTIATTAGININPASAIDNLLISDIKVAANLNVATISWQTNRPTGMRIDYGIDPALNKNLENANKKYSWYITLNNLQANTNYRFKISAQDDNGQSAIVEGTFVTAGRQVISDQSIPGTTASCNINLSQDFGYYGQYFNMASTDSGMDLYKGQEISNPITAGANYWYGSQYYAFSQVDKSLNFGGGFFPLKTNSKAGDPYHFAVRWRAIIKVATAGTYSYEVGSDDDSWTYIDEVLTSDLNGVHKLKTDKKEVYLTAGYHKFETFFTERSRSSSNFSFKPDNRLTFSPWPYNCQFEEIINYNKNLPTNGSSNVLQQYTQKLITTPTVQTVVTTTSPTGRVLGVTSETPTSNPKYICNNTLGYTPFVAVYKTATSPAVWAILNTGQKHYISSPAAFKKYGCEWREVKIVSQRTLNSYPNANLVRTPDSPTVYMLFERQNAKWLKIKIPSATVFVSYPENEWGNIAKVDYLDINSYPNVELVREKNALSVYLFDGKQKKLFSSAAVFNRMGYNWAEIGDLNRIHIESYEKGAVLQ